MFLHSVNGRALKLEREHTFRELCHRDVPEASYSHIEECDINRNSQHERFAPFLLDVV